MEKLNPKAVWIFFFQFLVLGFFFVLIFFGCIFLPWAISSGLEFNWWIISLLAIIWIFGSYGFAKLAYNAYRFEIGEDVFKKEEGIIWKKYVSIPYGRIQNIDIHRGILARILGLSDLMIQTAGYSGLSYGGSLLGGLIRDPEGRLPGLSRERAEEIREELIRKTKGLQSGL